MKVRKVGNALDGRLVCHPNGYGFVIPDDLEFTSDVFIAPRKMGDAVHGDRVRVRLVPSHHRRKKRQGALEGEVCEILSRGCESLIGQVVHDKNDVHVVPLDTRYYYTVGLRDEGARLVEEGTIVSVFITVQPRQNQRPFGKISEVLGDLDDPQIQYKIACHQHGIPTKFPASVLREVKNSVEPDKNEIGDRIDLRSLPTVTIDGDTAKDFDDAISLEKQRDGHFKLWVHVADVSHYVPIESAIDREAFHRGTSVYFPDRSVPMLPEKLSNNLCSLNPDVDRLALSVSMDIDKEGNIKSREFFNSVIRSDERMTYAVVHKIVTDRDRQLRKQYEALVEHLEWMLELALILNKKRLKKGALQLDLPEVKVKYDAHGEVCDVVRAERNEAHLIVEEYMLLANETVAQYLEEAEIPLIYRVHRKPDKLKLDSFRKTVAQFGYSLQSNSKGDCPPKSFQELIFQIADQPEEQFLSYLMLRSFNQAAYSELNQGHFGLATSCYTHFTSPIRRYPDLVVHRILKMAIEGVSPGSEADKVHARLREVALQSSKREREATEAERAIVRWSMAQFVAARLGEEYEAFVIEIRRSGMLVGLVEHFIEGFIPVASMSDDFYFVDQKHHCITGKNTKRTYRIGNQLKVRVEKISLHQHSIEFSPVLKTPQGRQGRKR